MEEEIDYSKYLNLYKESLIEKDEKAYDKILEEDAEKAFKLLCNKLRWHEHLVFADYEGLYYMYISTVGVIKLCTRKITFKMVSQFLPSKIWQKVSKYIYENKTMPIPDLRIHYGFFIRDNTARKAVSTLINTYDEIVNGKIILDKKNYTLDYYVALPKPEQHDDYNYFKSVLLDIYGVENLDFFLDWLSMYAFEIKKDLPKYILHLKGSYEENMFSVEMLKSIYPASCQINPKKAKIDISNKLCLFYTKNCRLFKNDGNGDVWYAFINNYSYTKSKAFSIVEAGKKELKLEPFQITDLIKRNIGRLLKDELFQRFSDICYFRGNNKDLFGFNIKKNKNKWQIANLINEIVNLNINIIEKEHYKKLFRKNIKEPFMYNGIFTQLCKANFITGKKVDVINDKTYYDLNTTTYNKQRILTVKSQNILEWSL